jgi:hypothetical protein
MCSDRDEDELRVAAPIEHRTESYETESIGTRYSGPVVLLPPATFQRDR